MSYDKDELIDCPYCEFPRNHQICFKKLSSHLVLLRKSNPGIFRNKQVCMFNPLHVINIKDIDEHQLNCPDNKLHHYINDNFRPVVNKSLDVPSSEMWANNDTSGNENKKTFTALQQYEPSHRFEYIQPTQYQPAFQKIREPSASYAFSIHDLMDRPATI